MPAYTAPLRDFDFVLNEVIQVQTVLSTFSGYEEATQDVLAAYLQAAADFCQYEVAPLNRAADEAGCTYHPADRSVTTPAGFKAAYHAYCELGFPALDCDPAFGGQGMPKTLVFPVMEMLCSSNVAWSMYPALAHGVYAALHAHGSPAQKATYLPPLVAGHWMGTMCLTEPHCGTDLGLIKTRAHPQPDGSYDVIYLPGSVSKIPNVAGTALISARYTAASIALHRLSFEAQANYVGRSAPGVGQVLSRSVGGYVTMRGGVTLTKGQTSWSLNINNLTGSGQSLFSVGNPFVLNAKSQDVPMRPRTISISLSQKFSRLPR